MAPTHTAGPDKKTALAAAGGTAKKVGADSATTEKAVAGTTTVSYEGDTLDPGGPNDPNGPLGPEGQGPGPVASDTPAQAAARKIATDKAKADAAKALAAKADADKAAKDAADKAKK